MSAADEDREIVAALREHFTGDGSGCFVSSDDVRALFRVLAAETQRADEAELAVETWVSTEAEIHREGALRDRDTIDRLNADMESLRNRLICNVCGLHESSICDACADQCT